MILAVAQPALADYYDGLRAYDRGKFASAAAEWRAAGDAPSTRRLGQLYDNGQGVPQSFVIAHAYYNIAAAQGDIQARELRDAIAVRMTLEDISRAQRMVENGAIVDHLGSVSAASVRDSERPPPAKALLKKMTSILKLDGEWKWEITLPNSPCGGMTMMPMWIQNGRVKANFSHSGAGSFTLFGEVAADGSAIMFADAEHLQFSFLGFFGPNSASGTTRGTGETDCDGTWLATKVR